MCRGFLEGYNIDNNKFGLGVRTDGSFCDHLTGLPTMTCFFDLAKEGCREFIREGKVPAILFFDLSGMKNYNHQYGFVEGDNILKTFSKLLVGVFGEGRCSRFVQDHFVVFEDEKFIAEKTEKLFVEWDKQN